MGELIPLLILVLIGGVPAFLISYFSHKKLVKSANKNARLISISIFIVSFLLITGGVFAIILYNISLER
jgi:hypothetical protein